MGRGTVPTGAKGTNNFQSQSYMEAVCSLHETIYQMAYAKKAMAHSEYHLREWQGKCDAAGHFCCVSTARDKTFTTKDYDHTGR